jgi:two-component system chemotaxis sensor kinase CheA
MVQVQTIFSRYPRMVRDLSHKLGKQIEFVIAGTEIEIDRMLLDRINEPLVHLLRNALDHGIEPVSVRKQAGKTETGTINLTARREKGFVRIEVKDDGKGLDKELIKQKAVEKGIITNEQSLTLSDNDVYMLICSPLFSTAAQVTDISGRGVGMDVVKNLVDSFNGKLEIKSEQNAGTTFVMHLPLSLAIIQSLLVKVSNEIYAVPLANIAEIVDISEEEIKTIERNMVMLLRDSLVPLVRLADVFSVPQETGTAGTVQDKVVVVVEIMDRRIGLLVNSVIAKHEIVIKNLAGVLSKAKGISGATILGDGKVVLIVDINTMIDSTEKKNEQPTDRIST